MAEEKILLEDGVSRILLEDGTSFLLLESQPAPDPTPDAPAKKFVPGHAARTRRWRRR